MPGGFRPTPVEEGAFVLWRVMSGGVRSYFRYCQWRDWWRDDDNVLLIRRDA